VKVILVGPAHPLRGGIANFNEALFAQYTRQGDDCEVISYSLQYPGLLFPGKTQFATGNGPGGLRSRALVNSINPFTWIKVGRLIRDEAPDLVVVHFWMPFFAPAMGTICKIARGNKKTKIVALCHNVRAHESRPGDTLLTKYFLSKCDGFIAMSRSTLDDLSLYTTRQNKLFVPHPIYDTFGSPESKREAREKLGLDPGGRYMLFFGMIRKYKGLDILLEAMAQPAARDTGAKLLVAGEFYDKPEYYTEIIDRLGLAGRVIIRDEFIPTSDVKHYFCACDLVTQTYHTATQSGVSQIAYHFESPMLVTNVGGLAEIVPHGKVGYVTDVDATSIAAAIKDFFDNNRGGEFARNMKVEKLRFSWKSMTDGIASLVR